MIRLLVLVLACATMSDAMKKVLLDRGRLRPRIQVLSALPLVGHYGLQAPTKQIVQFVQFEAMAN